jgi:hypothetical protein
MTSKPKDEKALVTVDDKKSMEIPEHLRGQIGNSEGMENVDQNDLLLPRLGLCQSLSPQRRKNDPAYIPGLEEGQLFNTVTQEIYGSKLEIVMIFFFKNRIKYFPIDEGGGIDCISVNGVDGGRISPHGCASCKFSSWGNGQTDDEHGNDAPLCTLYHNYMSYTEAGEVPTPLAISYKSTGIKKSKQILASVRLTNLPMYAKKYTVEVVTMRDGNNEWFEKKITAGGFVPGDEFIEMKHLYDTLKTVNIHIDTTGEEGGDDFEHGANVEGTRL